MIKRYVILVMAIVLAMLLIGCAARVSLPQQEAEYIDQVGRAILTEFVEHYIELFSSGRPPTEQELEYWTTKYNEVKKLYALMLARMRVSSDMDMIMELAKVMSKAVM